MGTGFLAQNFVPLMFAGLFVFLLSGIPVAFGLAATGLLFGFIGMEAGLFGATMFQALPQRVFGIMQNDTLLAIPFFTLMGIILERSGMAEDLLETVGQVFGPVRGGLAIAVILVGALLAATTGVVAAAVISMGLISLPIMLRYGYNRTIATGTITASGTLAQAARPGCRRCRRKPASIAKPMAPAATARCSCCSRSAAWPAGPGAACITA